MDLDEVIRKHALKNAHDYGEAKEGNVVGKVIAEFPEAKKDMRGTMARVREIIGEVNALAPQEIGEAMGRFAYAEKTEEKKELTLPDAEQGQVVTRFPPEPSGQLHIGHAKALFLDYQGAKNYGGKFLLRFDDTNPGKESQEFADKIKEAITWLGISWDGPELYTSDYLPELYRLAEQLINQGDAYVCQCAPEEIKRLRTAGQACACRENSPATNLSLWKGMSTGKLEEGKAILRLKGQVDAENTAMRDPALFRILRKKHFRQGTIYHIWPTYDFYGGVMDSITGVTHAMRSKEYELRDEAYFYILEKLKLRQPVLIGFSRLAIKHAPVSKRLLKPLVDDGKVSGWDDPRLPTLAGLRRRGIQPAAIKEFVLSFGLSKVESEPTLEALLVANKKILDPQAKRRYFVKDPVSLAVAKAPQKSFTLANHPKENLGAREIPTAGNFFLSAADAASLKEGETFRLKGAYNVRLKGKILLEGKLAGLRGEYAGEGTLPEKKFQWVTDRNLVCEILVPGELFQGEVYNPDSLRRDLGFCEASCAELAAREAIQFERYGFCCFDKKEGSKLVFVFTSA